ncbi:calmodulin-like protein 3 [Ipomoea triloba]|uniref:calmodulin-like protein 3 n=1 Tax=Ipomoea triloba TaxID=35885 RepID=UPI00125CFEA8|nr:calmodulin-like protein 3 [Ipomoea triloba]
MPTLLLRLFFLHTLLNAFLLRLVPKKLRPLLPASWYHQPTAITKSPPPSRHPRMDREELSRVFEMFDRNGDGHITKAELSDSLENMGIYIPDADLVAMIEKIDINGDGRVDIDEFGALYQSIMDERDEEEDMREAFNVFDINGDGFISVEELKSVLSSLGLKQGRSLEDCKKMIVKVDTDGDGMVDFAEFKQMMRRGGIAALSS